MDRRKYAEYDRQHHKLWLNMAYHISRLGFVEEDRFTLEELGQRLSDLPERPGHYRQALIVRYLKKYFMHHVESPVLRAEEPDLWKLNETLYRTRPPPSVLPRGRPRKRRLDLADGGLG